MELRHLRYFIAVAEELHFSRAAQRLNMSQPPLSQQISLLEQRIGVRLFDRDKRNVALTRAGERFLTRARIILASAGEAIDEAKRIDRGFEGNLSIGYMSGMMLVQMSHFLCDFREAYPSAEIDLRQMDAQDQYMAVIRGELDAGYVDISVGNMGGTIETAKLSMIRVFDERAFLCVARDHPLAARPSVSVRELADQSFIAVKHTFPTVFDDFVYLCRQAGFNPHVLQQVDSSPAAIAMVAAGYGVAVAPKVATMAFRDSTRLIALEEDVFSEMYLISRDANNSKLVRKLQEIARQELARS